MKKIGIIVDSFSGKTKKELERMEIGFAPEIVTINGVDYRDGVDINLRENIGMFNDIKTVQTAAPNPEKLSIVMEAMSNAYDDVIYFCAAKSISSAYENGLVASKKFKNVHVLNTKLINSSMIDTILLIKELARRSVDVETIIKKVEEISDEASVYLIPFNIDLLVKSGRIKGVTKTILNTSKAFPRFYYDTSKMKVKGIKRNFVKTVKDTIQQIIKSIPVNELSQYHWEVLYCGSDRVANKVVELVKSAGIKAWNKSLVAFSIAVHVGFNGIGINVWKKAVV